MKKRVYIYVLVMICGMFIYGCNKKAGNELDKDEIIDNSNSIDNTVDNGNNSNNNFQFETLANLMYKTDEEVINVLGEGNVINQAPDTESYKREYSHILEGENVITSITYDSINKVNGIYTYLSTSDWYKWEKVLTSKLGYPTKLLSISNSSSDMQTIRWRIDSKVVTLLGLKNSLSIQLE